MVKRNKEKSQLKKVVDTALVNGLVFTLLTSSLPAMAQEDEHWVGNVNKLINSVGGQVMHANQQSMAAAQQAAMMQQFQPQPVAAKYFPHCKISPAITSFPEDMCKDDIKDPNAFSMATAMKQVGYKYKNYYDQLLTKAQNSPFPVGLQCLEDAKKGFQSSMADRLNSLTDLMAKIKEGQQQFEANNKKLKEDMKKVNAELFGGDAGDIDSKTKDYADLFSQECQNIIGPGNLSNPAKGLNGLLKGIDPLKKKSANFMATDKAVYEKEIQSQIEDIKKQVKNVGVEGYINLASQGEFKSRVSGTTNFVNYQDAVKTNVDDFNIQYSRIKSEIGKVDPAFEIPAMDNNFNVDFGEFVKGSESYFKKQYINECATLADKGVALSTDQILKGLEQKSTGNRGTTIIRYKEALQGILDDDNMFFDDKMAKIKALQNSYGKDITITYVNGLGKQVTDPPYTLFQKTVALCEQKYTQDDTFKPGGSKAISQKKKVKRAKKYLNELKDLEQNFIADLTKDIYDKVINCEGMSLKSNSCNDGMFNPGQASFCIKHAETCSGKIGQCHNQANALVLDRKNKQKVLANRYNKNVEALVVQQKTYLEQLRQRVLADAKYLQQYFPGADYALPEDLFIKAPQLANSDFGIDLLGGGEIDFLEALPKQIDKMKEALINQSKTIMTSVDKYIGEQEGAMETNRQKWDNLASDCLAVENDYRRGIDMMNAENKQKYDSAVGEAQAFCRRFDRLTNSNPAAGCGEGDNSPEALHDDSVKIASFLSSEVPRALTAYSNFCATAQGEQNEGTEDDEDATPMSDLAKACEDNDNDWENVKDSMKKKILAQADSDLDQDELEKYLDGKKIKLDSIEEDLSKTPFGKQLIKFKNAMNQDVDYEKDRFKSDPKTEFSESQKLEIAKSFGLAKNGKTKSCENPSESEITAEGVTPAIVAPSADVKGECQNALHQISNSTSPEKLKKALKEIYDKSEVNRSAFGSNINSALENVSKLEKGMISGDKKDTLEKLHKLAAKKYKDPKKNFCQHHKNQSITAAFDSCSSKDADKAEKCFKDELKENLNGVSDDFAGLNRSIASLDNSSLSAEWSSIGEQRTQNCMAQAATGQRNSGDFFSNQMQQMNNGSFGSQGVIR